MKQAEWVCHCVEQRNRTLYLLVQEILKAQIAFFEGGRGKLTALTQRSVAEKLGMNESTISRAVRENTSSANGACSRCNFSFPGEVSRPVRRQTQKIRLPKRQAAPVRRR